MFSHRGLALSLNESHCDHDDNGDHGDHDDHDDNGDIMVDNYKQIALLVVYYGLCICLLTTNKYQKYKSVELGDQLDNYQRG